MDASTILLILKFILVIQELRKNPEKTVPTDLVNMLPIEGSEQDKYEILSLIHQIDPELIGNIFKGIGSIFGQK